MLTRKTVKREFTALQIKRRDFKGSRRIFDECGKKKVKPKVVSARYGI